MTNNYTIYKKAKILRNHGLEDRNVVKNYGYISRMDVIQSSILNFRLKTLKNVIYKRRKNANFYLKNINKDFYKIINEKKYEYNTYHTFVIQTPKRNKLINYLKKNGIGSAIHYPIPIHLQPASKFLNYKKGNFPITENQSKKILTIPIHQNLTKKEIKNIVFYLNKFAQNN